MHSIRRSSPFIAIIFALVLLSACSHIPEHARYIPKDAVVVAGINFKALGKKVAWEVIKGSKLFKEMQDRMPQKSTKDAVSGIEKAGLDFASTIYVYVKADNRYNGGNMVAGLLPLTDAGLWETYVRTTFQITEIQQHGDRKEVSLGDNMYVSWNNKLLVIINIMPESPGKPHAVDNALLSGEMESIFNTKKENSIVGNAHFKTLENAGNDVSIFVNYEQVMNQVNGSLAEKMNMSLTGAIWKDAVMTTGFNFEKGKITGDMHYYISPEMKDIGVAFGSKNADNEMISRLPNRGLDMVAAVHIDPAGIRLILEKMNMLGIANLGLGIYGLSTETVLDAFTGDMAFVINDFSLRTETIVDSFMGQTITRKEQKPALNMTYALKINDKDHFRSLLKLVKDMGLPTIPNGYVIPLTVSDSVYVLIDDHYLVASNKYADATGYLQGTFKSQKMSEPASSTVGTHPWGFYLDVQQFCKNLDAGLTTSPQDSVMITESKKLLKNIALTGGTFKNNAFEYHLDINFMNTEENSIIALMDYGMKMNDAGKDPVYKP